MRQTICCALAVLAGVLATGCGKRPAPPAAAEEAPQKVADAAPVSELNFKSIAGISLPAPNSEAEAAYLGVAAGAPFTLKDVKAPVVVVQLFDMYCTNCQREAPEVNRLFKLVQESDFKDSVRFIGVGKGNSDTEVRIFRERYEVGFPLFADKKKENTKRLGVERTPNFVVLDCGAGKVVSHQWRLGAADAFLEQIRSATKAAGAGSG